MLLQHMLRTTSKAGEDPLTPWFEMSKQPMRFGFSPIVSQLQLIKITYIEYGEAHDPQTEVFVLPKRSHNNQSNFFSQPGQYSHRKNLFKSD